MIRLKSVAKYLIATSKEAVYMYFEPLLSRQFYAFLLIVLSLWCLISIWQ
jgi:hypothetical protein